MVAIKEVDYRGFFNHNGRVAYVVYGTDVYFSAIHNRGTSTINAAEQVIQAICQAGGIKWNDYTFYEILTLIGYPSPTRKPGWCQVNQLRIKTEQGKEPCVIGWTTLGKTDAESVSLLPPEILQLFQRFISPDLN